MKKNTYTAPTTNVISVEPICTIMAASGGLRMNGEFIGRGDAGNGI